VFPANQRAALAAWRALFFKPAEFAPDPQLSQQINRGAYLVTGLGHCGECHNRRNIVGVSRWSGALEGGPIEGWYAPNLTSDAREGVGGWTAQQLAHYLKTGQTTHGRLALGPMKEVIDESLSHLDATDLLAIGVYLKSVPPQQTYPATVGTEFVGARPPGAATYLSYCGYCHGLNGEGLPGQVSELKGNGAVVAQGAENVIRVVLGGQLARDGLAPMPAIGAQMTDQQVADVVSYVRNAFGNAAPGTEPGAVAQLRGVTRTLLNGQPPQGCPQVSDNQVAAALQRDAITTKLSQITDVSMLGVIDGVLPTLTRVSPRRSNDDLVNDLTDAYCTALAGKALSSAERAERLGTFATLTYGQLQTRAP
jgi:mono/diheme cytochrome c family protein